MIKNLQNKSSSELFELIHEYFIHILYRGTSNLIFL